MAGASSGTILKSIDGRSMSDNGIFQQLPTESHVRNVAEQGRNTNSSAPDNQSQNR
jgi:hypothetical protein